MNHLQTWATFYAILFAVWMSLRQPPAPSPVPNPGPAPAPAPVDPDKPVPSAAMQAAVDGLRTLAADPDAVPVAKAHRDFAWVLGRKPITSTGKLKAKLADFHALLYANTPQAGTLPGFSAAFDAAFVKAFGDADASIDGAKGVEFVNATAWALGG